MAHTRIPCFSASSNKDDTDDAFYAGDVLNIWTKAEAQADGKCTFSYFAVTYVWVRVQAPASAVNRHHYFE